MPRYCDYVCQEQRICLNLVILWLFPLYYQSQEYVRTACSSSTCWLGIELAEARGVQQKDLSKTIAISSQGIQIQKTSVDLWQGPSTKITSMNSTSVANFIAVVFSKENVFFICSLKFQSFPLECTPCDKTTEPVCMENTMYQDKGKKLINTGWKDR